MSYTEQNMNTFNARCKSIMASLQNVRQEAAKLVAIYTNETASGADPEWVETNGITTDEHVDAILLFQDLEKFLDNQVVATQDRQQWMTPFLQG